MTADLAHLADGRDAAARERAARFNATVVWSPEQGWHDGPAVTVDLDAAGRLTTRR